MVNKLGAETCSACGNGLLRHGKPVEMAAYTSIKEWMVYLLSLDDFSELLERDFASDHDNPGFIKSRKFFGVLFMFSCRLVYPFILSLLTLLFAYHNSI